MAEAGGAASGIGKVSVEGMTGSEGVGCGDRSKVAMALSALTAAAGGLSDDSGEGTVPPSGCSTSDGKIATSITGALGLTAAGSGSSDSGLSGIGNPRISPWMATEAVATPITVDKGELIHFVNVVWLLRCFTVTV
jgi:hypothetical protein